MATPSDPADGPKSPTILPVEAYVAQLVRKRLAAGMLFRHGDRVLLVEPTYKPQWEIPGGAVEADESPWAGAARELAEELGWHRPVGRLLVVDHVHPRGPLPEGIMFVFDGGEVTEADVARLEFPDAEIRSAGLHTLAQARTRVTPLLADRITAALDAVHRGTTVLCEHGRPVDPTDR